MYRCGNKRSLVQFLRIRPIIFLSKDGKDSVHEGKMDRKAFVSRQSWHFLFVGKLNEMVFHTFTLTGRENNYVFRQRKDLNRRNESVFH